MNHRRLKKLGAISNAALLLALAGGSTLSGSAHAYDINSDVTVTPAQPQFWPTSEDLNIGYGAPGSLTISGGGQVTSGTWSDIGVATLGSVTVTGGGSRWNAGFVTIGQNNGDGTLAITNGGTVVANGVGTGSSFGAATVGRIIVDGASSLLDIRQIDPSQAGSGGLFLGNPTTVGSNSFLEITNQGTVSSDRGYLGYGFGSTAAVMIDGANSQWSNANEFSVGYGGSGQLTVQDGGRLTTSSGTIGSLSGASGTVLVTGSGSTWSNTGSLTIGNAGQGALTIAEQGSVSAATTVLGASSTGNGRLELYGNLVGRGVLTTSQITRGAGQGSILFNGGMVRATTDQADFLSGFQSGDIELHGDGLLIDTGGHNVGINAPMRGSGGLTKQGSGTLTLSTASSYTEGTIISGGQIIARSTGALGTGDVVVNGLGAALTFEGPNVSAGSRSITLTNAGWLYFNGSADAGTSRIHLDLDTSDITFSRAEFRGSSSAAGATILNEVTPMKVALAFLDDSNAGHATILNRDGSWAGFAHSASASNATITNESRGAARFEDSTTAGAAVITNRAAGFTVFTGSSSAGEAVLTNESGGAIYFSGLASGANARVINHAGGILEIANLSGAGTTLGSIEGAGTFRLGSKRLIVGGVNLSREVSGAIEGVGGSLTKTGTGTLTLSGASTYTGPTTVESGRLVVNGSLASSVTLDGGILGGTGTIGGLIVQSGGLVASGNSIGTLTVAGNVTFQAGSVYQVEVNAAGQSDKIAATGNATLTGGTVQVLAEGGTYQPSTTYTLLSANGGLAGTFAGVTSNFAYLDPTLVYDANSVYLALARKTEPTDPPTNPTDPTDPPTDPSDPTGPDEPAPTPVAFHSVAVSSNQYRTADAVEALGSGSRLFNAVIGQSVSGARQAFDALSGEAHASATAVAYADSRLVREAILTRLRQPLGSSLPTFAQGRYGAAYAADLPGTAPQPVVVTPASPAPHFVLWGEGFGSWGKIDSNGNAAGLDTSTGGFILGADAQVSDAFRLGVAGGFTRTTYAVDARLSSGSNDSIYAALYGSGSWGGLNLRLGASYAWHDFDVSRTVSFPGFSDRTHASYDGWTAQAFGELGYQFSLRAVLLEPFVGASVLRLHTDGFVEEGGPAALAGYGQDQDLATTTLGVRAKARIGQDMPVTLRGLLGWRHAFGDVNPAALLAFSGGVSGFNVAGIPVDRDALVAEAGLDWQISQDMTLGASYAGQVGQRAQDHAVKGSFTWRFGTR